LVTHPRNRKDNPMNIIPENPRTAMWPGLDDQAGLIAVLVGIWNDNGYPEPLPFETAHPIPPLGQRDAGNMKAGHDAIKAIDEAVRDLYRLRGQLAGELRANEDALNARVDRTLAEYRAGQEADVDPSLAQGSSARAALKDELGRLWREREAWEETARACVCPPGLCTRGEFRDHTGASEGCMVCADLDPDQPCYAAVVRGLRALEEAGR
jgi:hypothetical protein